MMITLVLNALLFSLATTAFVGEGYTKEDGLLHQYYHSGSDTVVVPYDDATHINMDWLKTTSQKAEKVGLLSYWDFIPAQIPVAIYPDGQERSWHGSCYENVTVSLVANSTGGTLTVVTSGRKNPVCSEFYDFGNRENLYLLTLAVTSTHRLQFTEWKDNEYEDICANGLKAFLFPSNAAEVAASVLMTISLFEESPKMVGANVEFIGRKMQWDLKKRSVQEVPMVASEIKSGDYFAIARLDGLDPLIMWGTGSHTGHTAMALWFGDELFVCESTGTSNPDTAYWPPPYGVIKTPFDQWVAQAQDAEYMVSVLRLHPTRQAQFNEVDAVNWFKSVEGSPYGWHNFVYSFIDTFYNNLPRPTSPDLIAQVLGVYEPKAPIESKGSVNSMFVQGLNKRLGLDCDYMQCIYDTIDPMGLALFDVASMIEKDEWHYSGDGCPNATCLSMVCDVFVMEMYRNSGLELPPFQSTEQAPKDTYQMALYDGNWIRPEKCTMADPELPYCQLLGDYQMVLPGYNSIEPYENMNHFCPAYAPVYSRTPTDC